jgi:hypothetical protein
MKNLSLSVIRNSGARLLVTLPAFIVACSIHAAVDFQLPNLSVDAESGPFTVPVRVANWDNLSAFQFNIGWEPSVLNFESVTPAAGLGVFTFGIDNAQNGVFNVVFDTAAAVPAWPAEDPIFNINFTLVPGTGAGDSSPVSFFGTPEVPIAVFQGVTSLPEGTGYNMISGQVSVVPEPINVALGTFAGLVLGVGAIRKYRNRKSA